MPAPVATNPARAYAYENQLRVLAPSTAATAYAYENQLLVLAHLVPAQAYAYERVAKLPFPPTGAMAYAYESTIPTNPNQLHYRHPTTGLWTPAPTYVWDIASSSWIQVI